MSAPLLETLESRAARALGQEPPPSGPVVIAKRVSGTKTAKGGWAMLRYVARLGRAAEDEGDRAPLVFDETGVALPREESALRNHLDDWRLLDESENLSRNARRALERGEDVSGWPAHHRDPRRSRLRLVQLHHIVLSAPGDGPLHGERLLKATQRLVEDYFEPAGHRVIYVVHSEHGRHAHVHLLVKARSEKSGRQLRTDRLFFDGLRADWARALVAVGDGRRFESSRRVDRPELRQRGLEIEEMEKRGGRAQIKNPQVFERRLARRWRHDGLRQEANTYLSRHDVKPESTEPAPHRKEQEPAEGVALERLWSQLQAMDLFENAQEVLRARRRFAELYGETPALALWYLRRCPRLFGPLGAGAAQAEADGRLEQAVRAFADQQGGEAVKRRLRPGEATASTDDAPPTLIEQERGLRELAQGLLRLGGSMESVAALQRLAGEIGDHRLILARRQGKSPLEVAKPRRGPT